ncbi:MAG: alpha/beta fold hydrolase [Burkholderiales bacterium]|nr:alpha/beta fold hydrolase [Burkholderiales bacterium]
MKPTLVLLPGLLCDRALWAPQIDALADVCTPWVADLTRDDSVEKMAARVLDEVQAAHFALAGLSMGGYVAFEIMRQAPERVTHLALLDTRARPDSPDEAERRKTLMRITEAARSFAPVNKRMMPLLVHAARLGDGELVRIIQEMADRTGIPGYLRQQQAIMSRADFRPTLKHIACPTLLLCGRQDAITLVSFHEEMASQMPHARFLILEQCGHLSTLEKPDEVNAALRSWLGKH